MRKAIVTLAVGKQYGQIWTRLVEPNWRRYAAKHGYDLICFDQPLDDSERARGRGAAWQKLLILGRPEVAAYDVVVYADVDIVMNEAAAPCIASARSSTKVGLCRDELLLPESPLFELLNQGIVQKNAEFRARRGLSAEGKGYRSRGLPDDPGIMLNTGVMVLGTRDHRQLLEHVYQTYEKAERGLGHEQVVLSYELIRNDAYEVLDPKFNVVLGKFAYSFSQTWTVPDPIVSGRVALVCSLLAGSYFLHFAGVQNWMYDLQFIDLTRAPPSLRMQRIAMALRQSLAPGAAPSPSSAPAPAATAGAVRSAG